MQQLIESLENRRLMAAGDRDPSFGTSGTAALRADLITSTPNAMTKPVQMAVDASGRTLVATYSSSAVNLVRLTPDGTIDTRFAVATGNVLRLNYNASDESTFDSFPPRIAIDASNRIYVHVNGVLTRYKSSGKIDRSFGHRGNRFDTDIYPKLGVDDFKLSPDGSIWLLGEFEGETSQSMAVSHLSADGEVDTKFGTDGVYFPNASGGSAIRVLSDGSVVAAGSLTTKSTGAGATSSFQVSTTVVKFKPNGRVDKTYGNAGRREYWLTGANAATSSATPVGIQPDGSVILSTHQTAQADANVMLTAAGRDGGQVHFSQVLTAAQFVKQPDGKEVIVDTARHTLRRVNADNTIDSSFNGGQPIGDAFAATVGADGSVLFAGTGASVTDARYYVRRVFGSEGPAGRLVPSTLIAPSRELPFRVVFRDDDGVNIASITSQVLRIIAPDGTSTRPILTGVSEANGNVVADFAYRPADHKLNTDDNGIYAVRLLDGRALDINGNASEARTLGSIVVNIA